MAGDDRAAAVDAGHADAVPGAGILGVGALPLLCRSRTGARRRGSRGPRRVPAAVSESGRLRSEGTARRSRRSAILRALQARPDRARDARRGLCAARRPVEAASRRGGVPRPAFGRRRRQRAVVARVRPAILYREPRRRPPPAGQSRSADPTGDRLPTRSRRRHPDPTGLFSGPARSRSTAAAAPRMCGRMAAGGFLPRPPSCFVPALGGRARRFRSSVAPREDSHDRHQPLDRTGSSHSLARSRRGRSRIAGHPRVAGHQWPWRLRLGNRRRGGHAPVPRPADRGARRAVRPDRHAESHRRADSGRRPEDRNRRPRTDFGRARRPRDRVSGGVSPRGRPPGVALRRGRLRHREAPAPAAHAEHRPCDVRVVRAPARRTGRRNRQHRAGVAPVREFSSSGGAGQRAARVAVPAPRGSAITTKSSSRAADFRRCG